MRWVERVTRALVWGLAALAILVVAGVFFLTRTEPGIRFVVDQGAERLQRSIRGSITYDGVDSPDLFDGAVIRGLEIRGEDGRLFARADTLELSYSIPALLAGDIVLYDVRAVGLSAVLERFPGQEEMNVVRIFAPGSPSPDSVRANGEGRRILLRTVELEGADVLVQLPVEDRGALPEGSRTIPSPTGEGVLRQYGFRNLDARLPSVSLSEPRRKGQRIQVGRLSTTAQIQSEPVPLEGLRGAVAVADSRIMVDASAIRLARSSAHGQVLVDWSSGDVVTSGTLALEPVELAELQWLVPELPDARATGSLDFRLAPDSAVWRLADAVVSTDSTTVRVVGELQTAPHLAVGDLRLELDPLSAGELDPWIDEPLPYEGRLVGNLQLDGTLQALAVGGRLELVEPGLGPTTARLSGIVSLGERPGVQGFQLDMERVDFGVLQAFFPERRLRGSGSILVEADGWFDEGMQLIADLVHEAPGLDRSRVEAAGTVRSDSTDVYLDLEGGVNPVDLRALRDLFPELDLEGTIEGPVRVAGRLGDLRVETELEAPQGRLSVNARFDSRDLAAGYEVDGTLDRFRLSDLFGGLPEPTAVSGSLSGRGRGLDRETLAGSFEMRVRDSRMARFVVDTARVQVRVEDGRLRVDTLDARTNMAHLSASGAMGLGPESREATLRVAFRNDSLRTARPLLLGDTVIAADTLSPLERDVLAIQGVDPDTLPTEASIALDGRLRGEATLRGWIDDFSAEGFAAVDEVVYGSNFLRGARLDFSTSGLPGVDGTFAGTLEADTATWFGRSIAAATVELEYTRPQGRARVEIERHEAEDYRVRAAFEADSLGGAVELEEMVLRFDTVFWNLEEAATVEWDRDALRVHGFRLVRPVEGGMSVTADGVLPREGDVDFDLEIRRLSLDRVSLLVQSEETLGGLLDLDLNVQGTARRPVASGFVSVDSLLYRGVLLTRVEGDVEYDNRRARGVLQAWRGDLLAGRLEGSVPMELSFQEVDDRFPPEPVDVVAAVDSFPLAVLATLVEPVDNVEGTVSGEVRFAGTPDDLESSGSFRLQEGAFGLPDLGIRPVGVNGTVSIGEDASAQVDLEARSLGAMQVRGTVGLGTPTNPTFDLTIQTSGFQAIDRRDLQARLGGRLALTGSYQRPVVTGSATVDEGVLRIEEFERSAEVVDLSDPRFFDVVDTTMVSFQPAIEASQNAFLQNLQMEVDLRVQRNTWLRSRTMNVEMGGNLVINWNRTTGELVLTGELGATRGTYSAFGRQFQVSEGRVEFVGTPGLNPNLSIQAVTRLRTVQGEPLVITASVTGTLAEPRVNLSSDAQPPIAESDLVSYLFFGRPSYALASGESAVLQGAFGAGSSIALGAVATQLGAVAQEAGLDYFAVSQESSLGGGSEFSTGVGRTFASTQVELGRYFTEDIFVSIILRPLTRVGGVAQTSDPLAGVRAEWQLGDVWTVEGFVEDRFTRAQGVGFGALENRLSKIFGFFLYRDWGY